MKTSEQNIKRISFLFLIIFLILAAGITIVGYLYYINYEKQYRAEIENQLSSIAELKISELVQWRKERLGVAEIFYKNVEFSGLVKRFFNNQNDFDAKKGIQVWLEHIHTAYQYNRLCLHDDKSNERFLFPNTLGLHSPDFYKRISDVIKSGKITFEDFYLNEQDKHIYLNISIPLFDTENNNRVIGILAMRIDPEQYLYPLINKWPTPSKTAETLLIRREGNDALFLNQLRFQKNTALNLRRPLTELNSPAALGKKEIMEGIDYRGVPVIAYVCPVPNSPWSLVVRMDISEVYAPLRKWLWAIIILVVVLLIGAGASIGLIWRKQSSKFYNERYQSTENIRELNRVYAVLSDINQAIVRIRKPQELFEKACDIAVEKGGFQMAWIGKINSQTKKVDVIVSKGVSEVHLKKIDFNCEGDESLLGIAGRVIKTGVHVISNDIQNDENILPQHKDSVMYGSKSFAAFPIKIFGKVWGVFKLYSREIGFFDKEELKLLDELALDISFSIEFAEKEAERKRAEEELIIANKELVFQNEEKEKRAAELIVANKELVFQNEEKEKRAAELIVANKELVFQNEEKEKRAAELIVANKELVFQNEEKEKRAAELIVANKELVFQNEEKEKRAAELIVAKEKAEESDKLKSEFLTQMSHEIRTPLNAIVGNVDYLNESLNERMDSDTRGCFDSIGLASHRIIRTIDLVLNVSELQTSGYNPQFVKVDLNSDILNKLYQKHQPSAKQKGLEIIYTCKEKDTNVIADEYSITQIFANLIDNAIKYTKKGKVEILLGKNKTGNIMVEVKDTGIGISKEFLPKLFKPFTQEEQGYTRSFEGNGLGLTLIKNYCDINNAVIEVESEKNVGSTFRVIFKN